MKDFLDEVGFICTSKDVADHNSSLYTDADV